MLRACTTHELVDTMTK